MNWQPIETLSDLLDQAPDDTMVELAHFRDGKMIWFRVRLLSSGHHRATQKATHWRPAT